MVTVPLPATIVPVTFVVLHPEPVQTEIGSACALPCARATTPKTASASKVFLSPENLGISSLLLVTNQRYRGSAQSQRSRLIVKAWRREHGGALRART